MLFRRSTIERSRDPDSYRDRKSGSPKVRKSESPEDRKTGSREDGKSESSEEVVTAPGNTPCHTELVEVYLCIKKAPGYKPGAHESSFFALKY